ncbi:MAG: hypothetical protein HRU50_04980 [Winogradskyella sp.]|uniref:hypothetical protein n=1 Tax=Winogradskyella sp. TaxID=1883156 RepID=UPI0025CBEEA3|nr:hypothetical protein [Winogradskyella sp.]NRB59281.1 hypothetical protein [Winogradskyella sp.]
MKQLLFVFTCLLLLSSCNSSDSTAKKDTNTSDLKDTTNKKSVDKTHLVPIDTDTALIATALMAAPKESRDNCTVIGYNMAGEFVTLKEGNNEFIVLADNPNDSGFSAACYHRDLEPFMARGRALKAMGKSRTEIFEIREEEAKSGKLDMGKPGSTLHIYYGQDALYDPKTSEVDGAIYRYVVYLPFATSASTGLPEQPISSNHPWIMNPGTHKAHIMISPKSDKN